MSSGIVPPRGKVAIVGVAGTYPGARRAGDFWQNIIAKVDSITDVDPVRWDPEVFYDPDPAKDDRLYSKKGGWIPESYSFTPLKFGIQPNSIIGAEPDHLLLFRCVYEALEDAGYIARSYDHSKVSLIIGKGNYVGAGLMWLTNRTVVVEMIVHLLRQMRPDLSPDQIKRLAALLRSKTPRLTPESAGGVVPNIATGRVANRLDLMGRNFSVDAACASALIATEIAVNNLLTGVDDMSIVGGLHIYNDIPFLSVFKVTRAISLTSSIRPFDENADGTMSGEGVGTLVLKRLEDAERDGDRIYAVIRGVGTASDGKGKAVMAPRLEGELAAIRRAFEMAEVPPESVGLVECHGTATTVGDATELEALETCYGPSTSGRPTVAIGSVKSMIGHCMPASGAASLIKMALSLHHRILPPTLNVTRPHPRLRKPDARFYVNTEARPWISPEGGSPRRAAVSAFGFGGINGHVILEEYNGTPESEKKTLLRDWESEVVIIEGDDRPGLIVALDKLRAYVIQVEGVALRDVAWTLNSSLTNRPHRVAIVASSLEELAQKIDRVRLRLSAPECTQIRERGGLYYFGDDELRKGKVAFIFPGEGSQYIGMLSELCMAFPEVRASFDKADGVVKDANYTPLSAILYPPPSFSDEEEAAAESRLWSIERATESVLTAGGAICQLLKGFGVHADVMTGHSAGEWIAMAASGMVDIGEFVSSMDRLNAMYQKLAEQTEIPRMAMLAVGAGREKVLQLAAEVGCEVSLANDNCPHQVVAVTSTTDAPGLLDHMLKSGVFCERLPYDRGYHTPSFTYICDPLREFFQSLNIQAPKSPVYSCTTTEPYSQDHEAILDTVANTFARPLLFRQTIERMYDDGARIFIECGPRGNLTAFVDDILRGKAHLGIPMDVYRRSGIASLNHAIGMMAAAHVKVDFAPMYRRRTPRTLSLDAKADSVLPEEKQPGVVQIRMSHRWFDLESVAEFPMPPTHPASDKQSASGKDRSASDGVPVVPAEPVSVGPSVATHVAVSSSSASSPSVAATSSFVAPVTQVAAMTASNVQTFEPAVAPMVLTHAEGHAGPEATGMTFGAPPSSMTMSDHFALMEEFLRTEEDIMGQAFLGGMAPSVTSLAPGYSAPPPTPIPAPTVFVPATAVPPPPAPVPVPVVVAPVVPASPAAPVVSTLVPAAVVPPVPAASAQDTQGLLLKVVSERTGYPEEMLGLDQDMEADLGIDSIKRVEIFGALRDLSGDNALSGEGDMEAIARLKTLRDVLAFLAAKSTASRVPPPALGPATHRSMLKGATTVEETAGKSLTLRITLDLAEHKYLQDHSLYFHATERDNQADKICIMPLTGSVELMCETAALLQPGAKVIGTKNVQILRRLSTTENQAPTVIDVVAKVQKPGEIAVTVRPAGTGGGFSSCVVMLAAEYPQAPAPMELSLVNAKPAMHPGKDIYSQHRMFHGPAFSGIRTVDSVGENGLLATLEILPTENLYGSDRNPQYFIDPHLLDAAGQLVGYWPIEYLSEGYVVLPVRIADVAKFSENPPVGSVTPCRLKMREVGPKTILADYDVLHPDGRVWLRVTGWQDWRFFWPHLVYEFWRFPNAGYCSAAPVLPGLEKPGVEVRRMSIGDYEKDSLTEEVWTQVLLDRRELVEYQALPVDERAVWLFVRAAAKDAVRAWVKKAHSRDLFPADIHLTPVDGGGFQPTGFWTAEFAPPQISTCIVKSAVFAAAGSVRSAVAAVALDQAGLNNSFVPDELERLDRMTNPGEWKARALAAKLAAARFLRNDPDEAYSGSLILKNILAKDESLEIADPDMAINAEDAVAVATGQFEGIAVAVAFL